MSFGETTVGVITSSRFDARQASIRNSQVDWLCGTACKEVRQTGDPARSADRQIQEVEGLATTSLHFFRRLKKMSLFGELMTKFICQAVSISYTTCCTLLSL